MGVEPTRLTAKAFYPNHSVKKPSWVFILVMFVVFFPVGIYLLHKRVRITRGRHSAAIITYAWSLSGAGFMLLCIIGGGGIGFWVTFAIFVFAWLCGIGDRVQWKNYDTYIALLMKGECYLPNIAGAMGKNQKAVISDLNEMFEDGIFAGSYINAAESTVVPDYGCLAKMGIYAPVIKPASVPGTEPSPAAERKTVVRCKGCGANVEGIVGQTGACEFCDSPVSFV